MCSTKAQLLYVFKSFCSGGNVISSTSSSLPLPCVHSRALNRDRLAFIFDPRSSFSPATLLIHNRRNYGYNTISQAVQKPYLPTSCLCLVDMSEMLNKA